MKSFIKQNKNILFFGVIVALFFILSAVINNSIDSTEKAVVNIPKDVPILAEVVPKKAKKKILGKITRVSRLNPNRTYYDTTFFEDGEPFAECKSIDHKVYDCTDKIPDGFVEFIDETKKTSGKEYYRDGKKDQLYQEYYSSGQLRKESEYFLGTMKKNKEYFSDGIMSKQEDFEDALWIPENKNQETGSGKVYFRDGSLMYEWHLTNQSQGGYTKSYDRNGRLVAVSYFDQDGDLIEENFLNSQ
ncbi:MAG: hypothetical protein PHY73_05560 [Candidatus Omnitrophica bacterium]|nr:hypothetical protein [Candidatus Omnitrophota bacterium]